MISKYCSRAGIPGVPVCRSYARWPPRSILCRSPGPAAHRSIIQGTKRERTAGLDPLDVLQVASASAEIVFGPIERRDLGAVVPEVQVSAGLDGGGRGPGTYEHAVRIQVLVEREIVAGHGPIAGSRLLTVDPEVFGGEGRAAPGEVDLQRPGRRRGTGALRRARNGPPATAASARRTSELQPRGSPSGSSSLANTPPVQSDRPLPMSAATQIGSPASPGQLSSHRIWACNVRGEERRGGREIETGCDGTIARRQRVNRPREHRLRPGVVVGTERHDRDRQHIVEASLDGRTIKPCDCRSTRARRRCERRC